MLGPYEFECNYSVHDNEFMTSINFLLGPALVAGNQVQVLSQTQDKTPLNLINTAKRSICVHSSALWKAPAAQELAEALAEKAQAGIPVHVVLPSTTGRQSFSLLQRKRFDLSEVEVFSQAKLLNRLRTTNTEDFTIATIDGMSTIALSPDWNLGFVLTGPVVGQFQAAFNELWMQVQEQVTHGEFYFSESTPPNQVSQRPIVSAVKAQYFDGTNVKTSHKLQLSALYSIGIAKNVLKLSSAIFKWLPFIEKEIKKAEQRGVQIEKITSDYSFLIADHSWTSFWLRKNAVLNIYDANVAREIETLMRKSSSRLS